MGSSSSKAGRTASGAAARKYPSRAPPSSVTQASRPADAASAQAAAPPPGPTVHPPPQASESRTEAVNLDASDPVYASQLRSLGAVEPNPILPRNDDFPVDRAATTRPASSPPPFTRGTTADLRQRQRQQRRPPEPTDALSAFPPAPFPPAGGMTDPRRIPSVVILEARQRLQDAAEREFRSRGDAPREFLDMGVVRQALMLRDKRGMRAAEIERTLQLKEGVMERLGPKGMVESL